MAITFDSKIKELEEKKSELDSSILASQKQKYEQRLAELLGGPAAKGSEKEILEEVTECYAKVREIDNKIEKLPENAKEIIEKLDKEIAFYQQERENSKNIQLYKDTDEGMADIFGSDIIEYAKETNNEELINKLRSRKLSEEECRLYFEQDYRKHDEDQNMYEELFNSNEKSGEGVDKKEIAKVVTEQEEPKIDGEESVNQLKKKKRVRIERPITTLHKLNVKYKIIDGIILPTKGEEPRINKTESSTEKSNELDLEYANKINILFSRVLTPENGFTAKDYNVIAGQEPKNMVRKTTYIVVEIPQKNKMIILNNGYGEASFLCDEIFDKKILTSLSKEELMKQYGKDIKKLEFKNEESWVSEILEWVNEGGDTKAKKENSVEKSHSPNWLNKYIRWLDDYPILSKEELVKLLELKETGDQKAQDKIIISFLKYLIIRCSKFLSGLKCKYKCDYLDVKDLIMEGYLGLNRAVEHFHINKKAEEDIEKTYIKFIIYVQCSIDGTLYTYLKRSENVGRGIAMYSPDPACYLGYPKGDIKKIDEYIDKFYQANGRLPDSSEIIKFYKDEDMGDERHGKDFLTYYEFLHEGMVSSLDKIADNVTQNSYDTNDINSEIMIDDNRKGDETVNKQSLIKDVDRALSTLTDRERDILKMFFGIGCPEQNLEEIGEKLGLTRERVRQIKEKAIRRLQAPSRSKILRKHLQ